MQLVIRVEFGDARRFDEHAGELDDWTEHDDVGVPVKSTDSALKARRNGPQERRFGKLTADSGWIA